ncbi:polyketide synthase [Stachybotrys elegans]|uniref:Polyketide synthase n=1 Tax=Stachybotrys elegans TaxID=80388 RepID=A0A8K0WJV0_9HYPO|nr:polyketide synthase [Stachybotrys elegans]
MAPVEDMKHGQDPVCIVGLACRLPGGIQSASDFWEFLARGKTAQGRIPAERFNIDGFYDGGNPRTATMNGTGGYFLQNDVRLFDNQFFNINNLEARSMDPQQRKLLEIVYECLENAGIPIEKVSGSDTGVYVSNFFVDLQGREFDHISRYSVTGSGTAILANRVSHFFDLHGPSMVVDTACSSSLYALHSALSAIESGDCESAIVAAANLIMSPEQHSALMAGRVVSPTSACHTFDASADGYGRGEALNALYLKPLSSALRDADHVWAVIRGTAVNSDGHTPGIMKPNTNSQISVIRKAYFNAGLDVAGTDYVECHGTGTVVGDSIEVESLRHCFGSRPALRPLMIGSVKTGLGHSEAASGLTSIIKACLAFHHSKIPATYGVVNVHPRLQLDQTNMKIVTEMVDWPRQQRRVSINSFGYGGANSHAVIESFDSYMCKRKSNHDNEQPRSSDNETYILPVSAHSQKSLAARIDQISQLLKSCEATTLRDVAFTLGIRRSHLPLKGFLVVQNTHNACVEVERDTGLELPGNGPPPIAFVFSGQGAQYEGMARELLHSNQVFSDSINELDRFLQGLSTSLAPAWSLRQIIAESEPSSINSVSRCQPVCTAIQIALVNVLRSWSITPSVVIGHSSGEIAATYAAGLVNARQAIITAYIRGQAVDGMRSRGAMAVLGQGYEDALELISANNLQSQVGVACINSTKSVTVSGSVMGIQTLVHELQKRKKFYRMLETDGRPYHSWMMKEIGPLYETLLKPHYQSSENPNQRAKIYSSVGYENGRLGKIDASTDMPGYWRDNLEQPVHFSSALTNMLKKGRYHLIEIGPHSSLKSPILQVMATLGIASSQLRYSTCLLRGQDADVCLKRLSGILFTHNYVEQDWSSVNSLRNHAVAHHIHMPPYPWDYTSSVPWDESRTSHELRNRKFPRHELLGSRTIAGNGIDWAWRNILHLEEIPWIFDHKVGSHTVFPAAGYFMMAVIAMSQISDRGQSGSFLDSNEDLVFRNVQINSALIVEDGTGTDLTPLELHTTFARRKLSLVTVSTDWFDFSISSWANGRATLHCSGGVRLAAAKKPPSAADTHDLSRFKECSVERCYMRLHDRGLRFGKSFQTVANLRVCHNQAGSEALSSTEARPIEISLPSTAPRSFYPINPFVLDACLQTAILGTAEGNPDDVQVYLPGFFSECRLRMMETGTSFNAMIHSKSFITGVGTLRADCTVHDEHGIRLLDVHGARLRLYDNHTVVHQPPEESSKNGERQPCFLTCWKPDVSRLDPEDQEELQSYVEQFSKCHTDLMSDRRLLSIVALADLVIHKYPGARVMEIMEGNGGSSLQQQIDNCLLTETGLQPYSSWVVTVLGHDQEINIHDLDTDGFDLILVTQEVLIQRNQSTEALRIALSLLDWPGFIISTQRIDPTWGNSASFRTIRVGHHLRLISHHQVSARQNDVRNPSTAVAELATSLVRDLQQEKQIASVTLAELGRLPENIQKSCLCILLLELDTEFLADMNQHDIDHLRELTCLMGTILWVTGADSIGSFPNADISLANGLSRTLTLEEPALRSVTIDIGPILEANSQRTRHNIVKALLAVQANDDTEFIQRGGLLNVSRFVPHGHRNSFFRQRVGQDSPSLMKLEAAGLARLALDRIGAMDTLYFRQICKPHVPLPPSFVDIRVQAMGLNAKDVYVLNGRVETSGGTVALEFSGLVETIGTNVEHVQVGDRVVVLAPNHFSTVQRVPGWAVHKLNADEDYATMSALLVSYTTALYALHDRANLKAGESVLIHAGAGALGMAAIQVAQRIGAVVYCTVSSSTKSSYLVNQLGVPESHIFNSRTSSFATDLMEATGGRGVDVVLNSLTGDLLHVSWDCIASFGRFIEVGKRDIVDSGLLQMQTFSRNSTFTAFDLADLYLHHNPYYQNILSSKVRETLCLYREGHIEPPPVTVVDVSEIPRAYRLFSSRDRIGKIVISLENPESLILVAPPRYSTIFNPEKVYLLVGCLGGLGRSLSLWMVHRGARHFVYLSRTGDDSPSAKSLVSQLRGLGASVDIIRGDVACSEDVLTAVKACEANGRRLGGGVQAAMALQAGLFGQMTSEAWHKVVAPKRLGAWNLHQALKAHQLDFLLLVSSISGSLGSATESNYCAANAFLDAFARWRSSQGQRTISLGLGLMSDVGFLHENPEANALISRRGIRSLSEDDFLQILDIVLSDTKYPEESHVLTGLEPVNLQGSAWQDPRMGILRSTRLIRTPTAAASLSLLSSSGAIPSGTQMANSGMRSSVTSPISWLRDVPANIQEASMGEASSSTMALAVRRALRNKVSQLLFMPEDQISGQKTLADFGIDSLIGSELRSWLWTTFQVSVSSLDIVSSHRTLEVFADFITSSIVERSGS